MPVVGVLLVDEVLMPGIAAPGESGVQGPETDPRLNSQIGQVQCGRVGNLDIAIGAVKIERPAHFTAGIGGGATHQDAVVSPYNIGGIAVTRPPADNARREWIAAGGSSKESAVDNEQNARG